MQLAYGSRPFPEWKVGLQVRQEGLQLRKRVLDQLYKEGGAAFAAVRDRMKQIRSALGPRAAGTPRATPRAAVLAASFGDAEDGILRAFAGMSPDPAERIPAPGVQHEGGQGCIADNIGLPRSTPSASPAPAYHLG